MTHRNGIRIFSGWAEPYIAQKNFVVTDANVGEQIERIGQWIKAIVDERDGVVLGLSGGVDSAVTARLAQVAGVPLSVLLMPEGAAGQAASNFIDAADMVQKFSLDSLVIDIEPICAATRLPESYPVVQAASVSNRQLARINIAPRVRANLLYEVAQLQRRLVIGTDNMDEGITGYFTKFGDGAYDFCPLSLITKREVYILARALGVPEAIINKPPSANLYEGQTDEAELGFSYEDIDDLILRGSSGNLDIDTKIDQRYRLTQHKRALPLAYSG
jgi:NAD+ synthase